MKRLVLLVVLAIAGTVGSTLYMNGRAQTQKRDLYLRQLEDNDEVPRQIRAEYSNRHAVYGGAIAAWVCLAIVLYSRDIRNLLVPSNPRQGL